MEKTQKTKLSLDGLNCANCAAKIENKVKNLDGIKNVELNFITKTLSYESTNTEDINKIKKIVNKLEPDVKVYEEGKNEFHEHSHEHEHSHTHTHEHGNFNLKKEIIRISIGLIFFIAAIITNQQMIIKISLYLAAYLIIGGKVLIRSAKNIMRGNVFDENFLMGIATIGAFAIKEYPEAVGVMLFYEIGEFLQNLAVDNSKKSIKSLLDIRPDYANLIKGQNIEKVSPSQVKVNDIIVVKPGEKVPMDGKIIQGQTMMDTSAITGESVPRTVKENDEILSGFVNQNGLIKIKVEKEFSESTVSKILNMVENASAKKAKTEKMITKFAKYYTPAVVFFALGLATIPVLMGGTFSDWLYRALIFLVISCPCGLVLSIPLGYFSGIGTLSKKGILIKGGNYLETIKDLDTIVFDKTGTITQGVFEVVKIKPENITKEELLKTAAYAEKHSNHPIAQSIKKEYNQQIDETKIKKYEEISGHGIKAKIEEKTVLAGNSKLMEKFGINYKENNNSGTIVHIAINGQYSGYLEISDKIKNGVKQTIKQLKQLGIKNTVMLTGDNKKVAQAVTKEVGIDEYYAELLPDQKVQKFEQIKTNKKIAFIGDGINDAPVLTRSDIGIAMGGLGSDAAIEAADAVIMDDNIQRVVDAIKVSKKTAKITWENIIIVLGVKIVFLSLGALGMTNIWGAVFADVGIALIAVFNSLRIFKN
ncbi:MAG: Zn2+/Cd2+-exporting ATPase [Oceanotoga sp.]|uniref:heavy metal translocating P-type ATPase n=1 Tax=Oceanotoga sp. TaxID=2108366 RepID=UPI00264C7963|nr:heavy metal translocating P-type ATPase [Oceanotoga sp.]MDN5341454.1 Zn2+/Cd2+-exporting ATPase [Oceanotoga sp.]